MVVEATIKVRFECPVDTGLVDGCQLAQEEAVKTGRVSDIHVVSYLTQAQIHTLRIIKAEADVDAQLDDSILVKDCYVRKVAPNRYALTALGEAELRALR